MLAMPLLCDIAQIRHSEMYINNVCTCYQYDLAANKKIRVYTIIPDNYFK